MKEKLASSLNLATWCKQGTAALGPGKRLAIWTQGCLKSCPGCISPEFGELKMAQCVDIMALATYAIQHEELTGLTISGGEPFLQASGLTRLMHLIRGVRGDFSCIVFTGFRREELTWEEATKFLGTIDLLIDGSYVAEEDTHVGLRGSTNQRFHFLTDQLKSYEEEITLCRRKREIHCDDRYLFPIGIPTKDGAFGDLFEKL